MEVGTSAEDELAPGDDKADWRYFKAEKARSYTVKLDHEPAEATVHLKLTRATGETVEKTATAEGTAEIASSLEPGLYYVEVAAETAVTYTVSVQ